MKKDSVHNSGKAFEAINTAYRNALITCLLDCERDDSSEENKMMRLTSIEGLQHIKALWVEVNERDCVDGKSKEPDEEAWAHFYLDLFKSAFDLHSEGNTVLEPFPSYWVRSGDQSTPIWSDANVSGMVMAVTLLEKALVEQQDSVAITLAITDAALRDRVKNELIQQGQFCSRHEDY